MVHLLKNVPEEAWKSAREHVMSSNFVLSEEKSAVAGKFHDATHTDRDGELGG